MSLKLGRELHRVSSKGCSPHTGCLGHSFIVRPENARPGKVLETRCALGTPHVQAEGPVSAWALLLFRSRCRLSCLRLAAHRSPGAEGVWVSTLLPSSSSSTYWQDCATEEASPRFKILIKPGRRVTAEGAGHCQSPEPRARARGDKVTAGVSSRLPRWLQ